MPDEPDRTSSVIRISFFLTSSFKKISTSMTFASTRVTPFFRAGFADPMVNKDQVYLRKNR